MRLASLMLISLLAAAAQTTGEPEAYVPHLNPVKRVQANYPDSLRNQGVQGMVRLLLTIDPQGRVTKAEVLAGRDVLRQPALDAVRQWEFRPVIRNGHSVSAYTDESADFIIPGKPFPSNDNLTEQMAASQRLSELRKRFPRSSQQVLADLEQDIGLATGPERFYALAGLAKAAVGAGALDKASAYANELLGMAAQQQRDWNRGNAIHDGNMVLGLVALRQGSIAQAKQYLLAAGKTPGSPQLDSFGPNMTLAQELIGKGERDAVLEYFSLCQAFWKMGSARLDSWSAMVRGGGMPEFGANLLY